MTWKRFLCAGSTFSGPCPGAVRRTSSIECSCKCHMGYNMRPGHVSRPCREPARGTRQERRTSYRVQLHVAWKDAPETRSGAHVAARREPRRGTRSGYVIHRCSCMCGMLFYEMRQGGSGAHVARAPNTRQGTSSTECSCKVWHGRMKGCARELRSGARWRAPGCAGACAGARHPSGAAASGHGRCMHFRKGLLCCARVRESS
jgi:hypothetical protein